MQGQHGTRAGAIADLRDIAAPRQKHSKAG
jgi:hypothetical protein